MADTTALKTTNETTLVYDKFDYASVLTAAFITQAMPVDHVCAISGIMQLGSKTYIWVGIKKETMEAYLRSQSYKTVSEHVFISVKDYHTSMHPEKKSSVMGAFAISVMSKLESAPAPVFDSSTFDPVVDLIDEDHHDVPHKHTLMTIAAEMLNIKLGECSALAHMLDDFHKPKLELEYTAWIYKNVKAAQDSLNDKTVFIPLDKGHRDCEEYMAEVKAVQAKFKDNYRVVDYIDTQTKKRVILTCFSTFEWHIALRLLKFRYVNYVNIFSAIPGTIVHSSLKDVKNFFIRIPMIAIK